jgi:hypothetical protein
MTYQGSQQPPIYPQNSSLAIISLISGIVSYFFLPLLGAIAAVITGNMAKKEIRESAGRLTGEGMATAGLILGWVNIGLSLVGLCLGLMVVLGVISLPFCLIPFANLFN